MADLSQLSDEQLEVYRDMLQKTQQRPKMTLDKRQGNTAMSGPPKGYVEPHDDTPLPDSAVPMVLSPLVRGYEQFHQGTHRFRSPDWSEKAGGLSDMFRGGAYAGLPVMVPGLAGAAYSAPLAFAGAATTGILAQQGTEHGLKALGVKPGYAQAASDVAGIAVPWAVSKLMPPKVAPLLKDRSNPQEREALDWAKEQNVPISAGQQTGNRGVQRVEQGLENVLGASGKAQDFYRGQEDALAKTGRRVTEIPGTQQTNKVGAGEGLMDRLKGRLGALKSYADKLYDSTRQTTAANTKEVQIGTKEIPASMVLDASGNPAIPAHTEAVTATLETPVDVGKYRQALQPIYEDLMRTLPPGRRDYSAAFKALQDVMTSDSNQMNAMDFDKFLSAVKAISRDGSSQYLTSKSQGLAKQLIKSGEGEFQRAIGEAGPNVAAKLGRARQAVREYYDMDDFMSGLNGEPAKIYDSVVNGGDRSINALRYINRVAPKETQTIGRTFLDGLIQKATAEGGFKRAPGIMADWNRLGPETKTLLFGKEQAKNLDNFMLAAKLLTENRNPSGTAKMWTALEGLGATGVALYNLMIGNPTGAAGVGAAYMGARGLANQVFTPAGVSRLTTPLTLQTPQAVRAGAALTPSASRLLSDRVIPQVEPPPQQNRR